MCGGLKSSHIKPKMKNEIKLKTQTNFAEVTGDSPNIRLIDFLIENDRDSWTMVEIKNNANIGYSTLKIILPRLLKMNIVEVKKKVGKSKLYAINKNNEIVKKIYELYHLVNSVAYKKLQKDLNSN
jgi:hypothetical protein